MIERLIVSGALQRGIKWNNHAWASGHSNSQQWEKQRRYMRKGKGERYLIRKMYYVFLYEIYVM